MAIWLDECPEWTADTKRNTVVMLAHRFQGEACSISVDDVRTAALESGSW